MSDDPVIVPAGQIRDLLQGINDSTEGAVTQLDITLSQLRDAIQTALATILAKIIAEPATEAKQDTISSSIGTLSAAAVTDPTASASIIALFKGLLLQLQGGGNGVTPVQFPDTAHRQVGNNSENNNAENNYKGGNTEQDNSVIDNTIFQNDITDNSVNSNSVNNNNVNSNEINSNNVNGNSFQGNQLLGINLNEFIDEVAKRIKVDARVAGSTVEEILTQADAVSNVLIFSANILSIEIWHDEDTPQEFEVNGLTLVIAPGGWRSLVGGTPGAEVSIPADVDCIVSRLV